MLRGQNKLGVKGTGTIMSGNEIRSIKQKLSTQPQVHRLLEASSLTGARFEVLDNTWLLEYRKAQNRKDDEQKAAKKLAPSDLYVSGVLFVARVRVNFCDVREKYGLE